jgi:hypothetical protein
MYNFPTLTLELAVIEFKDKHLLCALVRRTSLGRRAFCLGILQIEQLVALLPLLCLFRVFIANRVNLQQVPIDVRKAY